MAGPMLPQVRTTPRPSCRRYPTSLVGLHSLQSLQAVLPFANFFHHLFLYWQKPDRLVGPRHTHPSTILNQESVRRVTLFSASLGLPSLQYHDGVPASTSSAWPLRRTGVSRFLLFPDLHQGGFEIIRQRSALFLCLLDKLSFELGRDSEVQSFFFFHNIRYLDRCYRRA